LFSYYYVTNAIENSSVNRNESYSNPENLIFLSSFSVCFFYDLIVSERADTAYTCMIFYKHARVVLESVETST